MGIIEELTKKLTAKANEAVTQKVAVEAAKAFNVDEALAAIAKAKGGGGNYKVSIVDLLKLLDQDSSLDARKKLAAELGVNAGPHGSAEQNIALHKAVLERFAKEKAGAGPVSTASTKPAGGRTTV